MSNEDKCGIYYMKKDGSLKNIVDQHVVVTEEIKDDLNYIINSYLRTEHNKRNEYHYTSASLVDSRTKPFD